jgi:hypothetical protein
MHIQGVAEARIGVDDQRQRHGVARAPYARPCHQADKAQIGPNDMLVTPAPVRYRLKTQVLDHARAHRINTPTPAAPASRQSAAETPDGGKMQEVMGAPVRRRNSPRVYVEDPARRRRAVVESTDPRPRRDNAKP